jgi:hypothetical protein
VLFVSCLKFKMHLRVNSVPTAWFVVAEVFRFLAFIGFVVCSDPRASVGWSNYCRETERGHSHC